MQKGLWRWFKASFWPLFVAIPAGWLVWTLTSARVKFKWAFIPSHAMLETRARLMAMTPITTWDQGNHNHPFLLLDKMSHRGLFGLLWLLQHRRYCEIADWSSPRAVASLWGQPWLHALLALNLLSASRPGNRIAGLWSDWEGFPTTLPSSCVGKRPGVCWLPCLGGTAGLLTERNPNLY